MAQDLRELQSTAQPSEYHGSNASNKTNVASEWNRWFEQETTIFLANIETVMAADLSSLDSVTFPLASYNPDIASLKSKLNN